MQSFAILHARLSKLASDAEVSVLLSEFFSEFGAVSNANRFFAPGWQHKRYFLVQFKSSSDAIKVANRYRLRSFAFEGVLVEVGLPPEMLSADPVR